MNHDLSGDDLTRTLRERADDVTGTPLTLGDVRGRARQIRRRRAAGAAAAVALVAAVALPVALLGGAGTDKSDPDPSRPSPSKAVDPNVGAVPTLQSGVIIYEEGARIPLQGDLRDRADGFAVLGTDRYVVTASTADGDREVVLVDDAGSRLAAYPIEGGLAVQRNAAVAWMGPDGAPRLLVAGSDEPQVLASVDGSSPNAVAITGSCDDACSVHVTTKGEGLGPSWVVPTSGAVIPETPDVPAVVDVSPDGSLVAGLTGVAPDGNHLCGGVYDLAEIEFAWEGCEDNVFDFSPDGKLVATTFAEGLGPTRIDVRDSRTGEALAGAAGGTITSWAWEDDTHLLAVQVDTRGNTSLLRISADDVTTVLDGFHTDDPALGVPLVLPVS